MSSTGEHRRARPLTLSNPPTTATAATTSASAPSDAASTVGLSVVAPVAKAPVAGASTSQQQQAFNGLADALNAARGQGFMSLLPQLQHHQPPQQQQPTPSNVMLTPMSGAYADLSSMLPIDVNDDNDDGVTQHKADTANISNANTNNVGNNDDPGIMDLSLFPSARFTNGGTPIDLTSLGDGAMATINETISVTAAADSLGNSGNNIQPFLKSEAELLAYMKQLDALYRDLLELRLAAPKLLRSFNVADPMSISRSQIYTSFAAQARGLTSQIERFSAAIRAASGAIEYASTSRAADGSGILRESVVSVMTEDDRTVALMTR
ncbi:uncharacterized protein V1518DRAFT_416873 [Limtongia smithiae]|uniref:uncharacterized protein n=1 Tax=Limtongia smithiae TaxID=1125753 RepID=UPI0034CD97EC